MSFQFQNPGTLTDGEIELTLAKTAPGDEAHKCLTTYVFLITVDNHTVGSIELRIGDAPAIEEYGGHVGYGIAPEYQGHHYAEKACRLIFPLARAHGLTELWITCDPANIPSRRTCERLGGTLEGIEEIPHNGPKCRYRVDISQ